MSPFARIILAGVSPTEKPATEFKGLIAMLFFLVICYIYQFKMQIPLSASYKLFGLVSPDSPLIVMREV
jgi:hypothetical protein